MKICYKCKIEKQISEFYFRKDKNILRSSCRDCDSLYRKTYKNKNKNDIRIKNKKYREINSLRLKENHKKYDKYVVRKAYFNKYEKERLISDPSFKLKKYISRLVHLSLKGNKKYKSITKFLPYNMEEIKRHIEKQFEFWMSWENWGRYNPETWKDDDSSTWTWNIDHIIPQSKIIYVSMTDENFKKCWALENLRPLSAKKNVTDGNRR